MDKMMIIFWKAEIEKQKVHQHKKPDFDIRCRL